eukprot:296163-Rhodomonas_salina.2
MKVDAAIHSIEKPLLQGGSCHVLMLVYHALSEAPLPLKNWRELTDHGAKPSTITLVHASQCHGTAVCLDPKMNPTAMVPTSSAASLKYNFRRSRTSDISLVSAGAALLLAGFLCGLSWLGFSPLSSSTSGNPTSTWLSAVGECSPSALSLSASAWWKAWPDRDVLPRNSEADAPACIETSTSLGPLCVLTSTLSSTAADIAVGRGVVGGVRSIEFRDAMRWVCIAICNAVFCEGPVSHSPAGVVVAWAHAGRCGSKWIERQYCIDGV